MKDRKTKMIEYYNKYGNVPKEYRERILWLHDKLNITEPLENQILTMQQDYMNLAKYETINIVLYEIPEGTPRPRAKLIAKKNIVDALGNNANIHIYSPNQYENHEYMKMWVKEHLKDKLEHLICTPCWVDINCYFPIPNIFNKIDTMLAELGIIRYLGKPDADNIAKSYLDAMNDNVYLDDTLVTDLCVHRYYSVLPRIEIALHYLNMLGNKYQYNAIISRKNYEPNMDVIYYGQF